MYQYVMSLFRFDIFNKGKKKFIDNFVSIIESGESSDIQMILMENKIGNIVVQNDLFFSNFEVLSKKIKDENLINCIKSLYRVNKDYILKNKEIVFKYYNSQVISDYLIFLNECGINMYEVVSYLDKEKINMPYNLIVTTLLKFKDGTDIVSKNLDFFTVNNNKLLELKKILYNTTLYNKVDNVINSNGDRVIEEIMMDKVELNLEKLKSENILDFLRNTVNELLTHENIRLCDIKKIGAGSYSAVYQFGTKVLKIGKERRVFNMKNNKRFLKPLYRQNINSNSGKFLFCIEITEKVDTNNINIENLYQIYKELRELGYVWLDARLDNLGRLTRDNKIYFSKITHVSNNSTGYMDNNDEVLNVGDIVIIDNDYIFPANELKDSDIKSNEILKNFYDSQMIKSMENRYQMELQQTNKTMNLLNNSI